MPRPQKAAKGRKPPDKRPARARYWLSGSLCFNKIKQLVQSGLTWTAAFQLWQATRRRRQGSIPYDRLKKLAPPKRLTLKKTAPCGTCSADVVVAARSKNAPLCRACRGLTQGAANG